MAVQLPWEHLLFTQQLYCWVGTRKLLLFIKPHGSATAMQSKQVP